MKTGQTKTACVEKLNIGTESDIEITSFVLIRQMLIRICVTHISYTYTGARFGDCMRCRVNVWWMMENIVLEKWHLYQRELLRFCKRIVDHRIDPQNLYERKKKTK